MRPEEDDLDEEIRGHLAISIKDRIERGESPAAARLAALREFGHPGLTKDDMAGVWRNRLLETPALLLQDLRIALRSLLGDHVDFNATTKAYNENTNLMTAHSPILGWMRDGFRLFASPAQA